MIGLYYAILALVSVPFYVLSVVFKERENKIGVVVCYAILFLIVLLMI